MSAPYNRSKCESKFVLVKVALVIGEPIGGGHPTLPRSLPMLSSSLSAGGPRPSAPPRSTPRLRSDRTRWCRDARGRHPRLSVRASQSDTESGGQNWLTVFCPFLRSFSGDGSPAGRPRWLEVGPSAAQRAQNAQNERNDATRRCSPPE